ncbi:MAG: HAD family phosphatase [Ignavibacteria bacterium]|nr:HAD family phosphatase [Ignavibacteria bacterium]
MYKTLFWDNDGVLVDTEKLYFQANALILRQYGINLSLQNYIDFFLKNNSGAWHLLGEVAGDKVFIGKLRNERNNIYRSLLETEDLRIEGIEKILKSLSKRYIMAIVTSSRKEHFEIIHKRTSYLKYFDFSLVREDYNNSKPDPEPYLKALSISKTLPEEALVIEDSERGLISAKSAGIDCWIIKNDLNAAYSNFGNADNIFNRIEEILDFL